MTRSWRDQYRRCERCKAEYHPQRQSQSYCCPACRRAAAYGRERFAAGTTGRRRRRLEASDKAPGIPIAGSFRNESFSSIETIPCKPTKLINLSPFASGRDARSVGAGRCSRRTVFRVTCSVLPSGNPHVANRAKPSTMASEPHNLRREGSRPSQTRAAKFLALDAWPQRNSQYFISKTTNPCHQRI